MKIAIIGLGLMGGSLALCLRKLKYIDLIVGFDRNEEHQRTALKIGLIDKIIPFDESKDYDVIFLATPVEGIKKSLQLLTNINTNTTIIDLGSTKNDIIDAIPKIIRKNAVAAHPMTGIEKFGPEAAFEALYPDKIIVFCNLEDSGKLQKEVAVKIFTDIGMKIVYMDSQEHDLHAAFISHMPHFLSYALANSVISQEDPESILTLAAGGFRDMSRLAKSSPNMWIDIFKNNKKNTLHSLEKCEDEISKAKKYLIDDDWDSLKDWIINARKVHKVLPN